MKIIVEIKPLKEDRHIGDPNYWELVISDKELETILDSLFVSRSSSEWELLGNLVKELQKQGRIFVSWERLQSPNHNKNTRIE